MQAAERLPPQGPPLNDVSPLRPELLRKQLCRRRLIRVMGVAGVCPSSHRVGQEFTPDARARRRHPHASISQTCTGGSGRPGRGRGRPPDSSAPPAGARHHTRSALIWELSQTLSLAFRLQVSAILCRLSPFSGAQESPGCRLPAKCGSTR